MGKLQKAKKRSGRKKKNEAIEFLVNSWEDGRESYLDISPRDVASYFSDWVAICALKNASSVAKVPYKMYVARKAGTKSLVRTRSVNGDEFKQIEAKSHLRKYINKGVYLEEILEHPFIDLMEKANPFMSGFDLLEMTQLHLESSGNAYWYLYKNSFGIPIEAWCLPPQNMYVVPSKKNFIEGYIYRNETSEEIPYDPDEIIHFKFPSIKSLYVGMAPWQIVTKSLNTSKSMDNFESSLFKHNARPEGVLYTENVLGDRVFERVKKDWQKTYSGTGNAGKTVVLEKGLKYQQITINPKDLAFLEGKKQIREVVTAAYGVPLSAVTTENVNLANAVAGEKQYCATTILPRVLRNEGTINEKLLSLYGDNIFISFDSPVPEDKAFKLKERDTYIRLGLRLINEYRREDGLQDVEWGNKPVSMFGNAPVSQGTPEKNPDKDKDKESKKDEKP